MADFVSIVIPERNEEAHISECLNSIIGQSHDKESIEVLIIDGMSTDRTRAIVEGYSKKYSFIKLLDNPRKIVPCALNIGIKSARGKVIIRMDAHTYYDKDYVSKCVETLHATGADNVGGRIVTLPGSDTLVARAIALATSHSFGVGNSKFRTTTKGQYVDTVAFGAFRREIFDKVGPFNEKLIRNQDIELNSRIIRWGGKIYLNPEIKAYYYNQATLKGLWRQNFGNGMWNVLTLSINSRSLSVRHLIPLIFVTGLGVSGLLSIFHYAFLILFLLIAASYVTCNLFVSLRIGTRENFTIAYLLPLVFGTLHFSYGFGYLMGLVKLKEFRKS